MRDRCCRFLFIVFGLLALCALSQGSKKYVDKVLLISMDGFRWDYIQKARTPNFDTLASLGVKAPYINNTFITKTFPCHYSIATGLYEESHGIIGNRMYDPVFNETFNMGTKATKWWDGGEPIWITVKKGGLKSGVYFWPGSETEIQNMRPDIWMPYEEETPFEERVDAVIEWFTNTSINLNMVNLYFHEPDRTGHDFGPDSNEIIKKVEVMDTLLGYIVQKFEDNKLWDKVNVIVTSDHGMTGIDVHNRVIDISELVNMSLLKGVYDHGPVTQILPKDGQLNNVYNTLSNRRNQHMTVFRKEHIPDFWHYKHNRRIMPIFILADEGWVLTTNKTEVEESGERGTHGYDNRLSSMKPIFYARGPNFKKGYEVRPFRSVDIYRLICELLDVTPAPNNGSLEITSEFLVPATTNSGSSLSVKCFVGTLVIFQVFEFYLYR